MKGTASVTFLSVLLFTSGCAVPRFDGTLGSTRRALLRGEGKEALASYESQAQQAEINAASSWFSQQHWAAAVGAYIEAATAAQLSGQFQKAIIYGEKALEIAHRTKVAIYNRVNPSFLQHPPLPELHAISTLIPAYRSVRNFERVRVLIEEGLRMAKEFLSTSEGLMIWESRFYTYLGRDLVRRGEHEKAIDALSQAVYLRQILTTTRTWDRVVVEHSETELAGLLIELGNAYRLAGRSQDALESYQLAIGYVKKGGTRYTYQDELHIRLGEVFFQQDNFSQALENFNKALALSGSRGKPDAIRLANLGIGEVLRVTGKVAEAIPHYQKSIQQIESTRSLIDSQKFRQSFFEGELVAYLKMIDALLLLRKEEEAFNYSEHARSRTFLDILGSKIQLSKLKSGLLEEEKALQERINVLRAQLADEEESQGVGLPKELAEAESAYNSFLAKVRKRDKEQASLMAVEPLTLKEVQELLDPMATLVEYFVTEREILIWVVEKEKLQFRRVELPKEKLSHLVKTLRESIIAVGEREKFNEVSSFLYEKLIAPLLSHVTGKELIIVPHDVLHYLPFHALIGSDGHYFIEKYPIYYLSSASLLQFTKEKRRAIGEKVLALGNPDLGDPKMSLEFAELEAKEVQKLYPQSTVLLKREATEEKGKALSPQHDILHFATHAELNEDDPLSSAILLVKDGKEDGRLEVREIFGMDLKANLVVLSACETGLGKLSTGDELVGLTRAFIYAGTPSVVASLWKVEDSSTAQLMGSFYKNLRTMTKVEALRQAQLELIRGDDRSDLLARRGVGGIGKLGETPSAMHSAPSPLSVSTSHPYFWAPFILVGDGK